MSTVSIPLESPILGYGRTLWRRKWTVVVTAAIAAGAAFGFSETETPQYQATSQLLLQPSASASLLSGGTLAPNNISDEIAVIQGPAVATMVAHQVGSAPTVVATNVAGTDIVQLQVTSSSPTLAARAANAYAGEYLSYEQTQTINSLVSAAKVVQARISAERKQIARLQTRETHQRGAQLAATEAQVTAVDQQITALATQLDTLQSSAALGSSNASLLSSATPPTAPSSPKKARDTGLGGGAGLVLGIALAFVRESLDDTIGGKEDLDRLQPELPVLAQIPYEPHAKKAIELVTTGRPNSAGAEAYRSLRTSIQFLSIERPLKALQVTSPRSGDGKTTTIANLAVALAGADQRVIVLDCDLRRSRQHEVFKVSNEVGFTAVVLGDAPLSKALQTPAGYGGQLRVLPAGRHISNPSELLSSQRTGEIIASLGEIADLVLIDSPPVLPVTDAVALAPRVDATILLVAAGQTTGKDLAHSLEVLGQVSAPVVGAVINASTPQHGYGYRYHGYHYRYPYEPYPGRSRQKDQPAGSVPS